MNWYLKKPDGAVFGPADLETLRAWAADGRVQPGDKLSSDRASWQPAHEVSDLEMRWRVELATGDLFGPIHLLALRDLVADGSVRPLAALTNLETGVSRPVSEELLPAVIELNRLLMESLSGKTARHAADAEDAHRWRRLYEEEVAHTQARIAEREKDLASRLQQAEAGAERERAAAEEARKRQLGAEEAYRDILKQFRELNDKFIRLRQELMQAKARPA